MKDFERQGNGVGRESASEGSLCGHHSRRLRRGFEALNGNRFLALAQDKHRILSSDIDWED